MRYNVMIEGASGEKTFQSTGETTIYGTGQGWGNSPIIWLFISNILIRMFSREAIGATYMDNSQTEILEAKISAYVDDINTHCNSRAAHQDIILNMQNDFIIWKNLLDMSGGALSQQKCNFYILSWDFMKSGIPVAKDTYIDHLSMGGIGWDFSRVQESHQTLGYKVFPTNPVKTQQLQWREVEKKVESMLRSNEMTYLEEETLYQKIYLPKVRYFLPFMSLPGNVIKDITQQNIKLLLRKCGYAQTMSRDIVFGNKSLGGLGWCDMKVEQGLHNLGTMISGLHNNEIVGQVHKAMMRTWFWALEMNPLKHEFLNITHDESLWPKTTAKFMSKHNIRIALANPIHPLLRENDQYIMTLAYNLQFTAYAFKYINYCRLFLNVISIADLTDAIAKYVSSEMYQIRRNSSNRSDSRCVQQVPQAFKTRFWNKFLSYLTIPKR
jgi:hypothetical protein